MRKTYAAIFLCVLFVFSNALAAYSDCAPADHHVDFGAEHHEAPSIHCPDAYLSSTNQAAPITEPRSKKLSRALPAVHAEIASAVLLSRFEDHPFFERFSQQGLFRFKEVFRL